MKSIILVPTSPVVTLEIKSFLKGMRAATTNFDFYYSGISGAFKITSDEERLIKVIADTFSQYVERDEFRT